MAENNNIGYSHIDWETELNDYFNAPHISIARFADGKPYSYWALRDRIRKDPRYHSTKKTYRNDSNNEIRFLPVVVRNDVSVRKPMRINGFEIEVDEMTDPESLRTVLKALRDL